MSDHSGNPKPNGHPDVRRPDGSVDTEKLATEMHARTRDMAHEQLRKLNHREWLAQAAVAFETQWRQQDTPMTPFRQGMIARLKLAADYIELLERDARHHRIDLRRLQIDLENALNALREPSTLKGTGA